MDFSFKNMSQLQEALDRMNRPPDLNRSPNSPTPSTSHSSTPLATDFTGSNYNHDIKHEDPISEYSTPNMNPKPQNSVSRTNSSQMSTSALLMNMAALQTTTNNKIDKLTDAVYGLHNAMEKMHRDQIKQSELLTSIVRNTANIKIAASESKTPVKTSKGKGDNIKQYGFATTKQLFAEFLMKLLQQIQAQIINKGKRYNSTRDMNLKLATQLVSATMDNEFKMNGIIDSKIDANSQAHPSLVKVANSIGSIDDTNPILTPEAYREIFDDVESKFFVSCFQKIIERLRIIKLLVPFYEADIICAIDFPYFSKNGEVICSWPKIIPRNETTVEALVASASISQRKMLAQYLAKGLSERAAVGAALNSI